MTNNLLCEGLQKTFSGLSNIQKGKRAGFEITSSHFEEIGKVYHDEWVVGGGQELAKDSKGVITRTYVGNTVSREKLKVLKIGEKDVMEFLEAIILGNGNRIRFDADFSSDLKDWKYSYRVTFKREDPFIVNGVEEITYKGEIVFVHTFGISRVDENN